MGNILPAALTGGVVAGALDIIYICTHVYLKFGAPPTRVWQSVAAGLMGREAARAGGLPTALFGLGLHFFIAIVMALVYVVAATRIKVLTNHAIIVGVLYGLALYAAMQFVVLPLSAAGPPGGRPDIKFDEFFYGAIIAHTLLVGVPIALIAKRLVGNTS